MNKSGPVEIESHESFPGPVLALGTGCEPGVVLALAIGASTTAADHFRQDRPVLIEMENAIMVVEDEVTRTREAVAGSALHTMDGDHGSERCWRA